MLSRPMNRQPPQKTPDGELNHESIFTQTQILPLHRRRDR
jgi:hypothetical protein